MKCFLHNKKHKKAYFVRFKLLGIIFILFMFNIAPQLPRLQTRAPPPLDFPFSKLSILLMGLFSELDIMVLCGKYFNLLVKKMEKIPNLNQNPPPHIIQNHCSPWSLVILIYNYIPLSRLLV